MYYFIMNENNWKFRWTKEQIKAMLLEQMDSFWQKDTGIKRSKLKEVERAVDVPHTVVISGLRRVGKSTLLAQIAHKLGEGTFYYLNFEDDRFSGFEVEDFNDLYQTLIELFGERKIFLLDEIQNIEGWEHIVRRFMDMSFKFYITGSNASLLSKELGSRLTGRYVPIELFPFSFVEYLQFREVEIPDLKKMTTIDIARVNRHLNDYLVSGGIPDALKYPELPLLRSLYDDVIYRDIATRYRLDAVKSLKELAFFLISNPASLVSFNKLKQQLRLGSVNTVSSYIEYMENSWLIFTINIFSYSVKRQQIAPKKVYAIDTGMVNTVGFHASPNWGKLLENLVYLTLRQHTKDINYYVSPGGFEVDFYLPEKKQLIQVARKLENNQTRERELRAISDAVSELEITSATILSESNEEDVLSGKIPVNIQSVAEWLITHDFTD